MPSTSTNEEPLKQVQNEIFLRLLPLIVGFILLGLIGFIGNWLAIIFYFTKTKRTPTVMLIGYLAVADLVVCVLLIPNIIELSINVMYTEKIPCKIAHFVGLWSIQVSGLTLGTIAIDRHRKICNPFGKQFQLHHVKRIVIGIVVFTCCLSSRNLFLFDITKVIVKTDEGNSTIEGYFCTTLDEKRFKVPFAVFSFIDFMLMITVWVMFVVCYSHIVFVLCKAKTKKKKHTKIELMPIGSVDTGIISTTESRDATEESKLSLDTIIAEKESSRKAPVKPVADSHSVDEYVHSDTNETGAFSTKPTRLTKHSSAMSSVERNLTFMMLVVSAMLIVCFTPYFIIKLLMRYVLQFGEEFELGIGAQFAIKFPYINSVINPAIYCYFNPRFREYIKELLRKVFLVCRRGSYNL